VLYALIILQALQVAILWTHDWVQLGNLTDIAAVKVIQSVPFTIGLIASIAFAETGHPTWLWDWLWISYGLLLAGELRAWWWPYLIRPEPDRAARYRGMFGRTSAFLPERNGIVPNTLHVTLHAATAATLILLGVRSIT
jgi:hypothetical protein